MFLFDNKKSRNLTTVLCYHFFHLDIGLRSSRCQRYPSSHTPGSVKNEDISNKILTFQKNTFGQFSTESMDYWRNFDG